MLAEEWGFFVLLLIYLSLLVWGLVVASNSKDGFGSMVAVQLQLRLGRKPAPWPCWGRASTPALRESIRARFRLAAPQRHR